MDQSILERIKVSRGTSEPAQAEPTESAEVVNVSEDAPIEYAEEVETVDDVEESAPIESESVTANDEEEDLYVDYKGREINLKDIEEWEQGHLRQADYTRKTQELAQSRKDFDAKQEAISKRESELNDKLLMLEAMVNEDKLTAEEIAELREYEPEEYIKYIEKQSKRAEFLKQAKTAPYSQSFNAEEERAKLWNANPSWMDNGKQTKAYESDMNLLNSYMTEQGYTQAEVSSFRANHFNTMLDAARYKALNNKNVALSKQVRKAPVTTKPKASATGIQTALDKAQKAFNQKPSVENGVALRKAKRLANN